MVFRWPLTLFLSITTIRPGCPSSANSRQHIFCHERYKRVPASPPFYRFNGFNQSNCSFCLRFHLSIRSKKFSAHFAMFAKREASNTSSLPDPEGCQRAKCRLLQNSVDQLQHNTEPQYSNIIPKARQREQLLRQLLQRSTNPLRSLPLSMERQPRVLLSYPS